MTPLVGCLPPVCMLLASLFLVAVVLAAAGVVKDPPGDPDAPPPGPSTFPGWRVALLIATAVALLMWVLTVIAAPV
jgi:hypothetical protein